MELELDRCFIQVADLRARVRCNQPCVCTRSAKQTATSDELLEVIRDARSIDDNLIAWHARLPCEWACTELQTQDKGAIGASDPSKASTYDGTVHRYGNYKHATTLNSYRASRLTCNTIICGAARVLSENRSTMPEPERKTVLLAVANVTALLGDVCASVPYFLNPRLLSTEEGEHGCSAAYNEVHPVMPRIAFMLVMPLIVSLVASYHPVQHEWLRSRLRLVSSITGSGTLEALSSVSKVCGLEDRSCVLTVGRLIFARTCSALNASYGEG